MVFNCRITTPSFFADIWAVLCKYFHIVTDVWDTLIKLHLVGLSQLSLLDKTRTYAFTYYMYILYSGQPAESQQTPWCLPPLAVLAHLQ